jgi:predicted ATP-grasp superfamily ATP-dependent carboligase
MLVHEGGAYALVTHHRLRSLSPTGGASVLKETLGEGTLRNQLEAYALKLVEKLSWTGPIMVEFKVDSDTRTPYLMEINGRFWGSLPLSIASGVDMPYLLYQAVMQNEISKEIVRGRDGVRSTHFLGDVQHLLRVLFKHDPMRKYLYPKRSKALRDFLLLPPRTKPDVWSFTDPSPSLFEIIDIIKKMWYSENRNSSPKIKE